MANTFSSYWWSLKWYERQHSTRKEVDNQKMRWYSPATNRVKENGHKGPSSAATIRKAGRTVNQVFAPNSDSIFKLRIE